MYQIWYGFVAFSITTTTRIIYFDFVVIVKEYCEATKVSLHLRCCIIVVAIVIVINVILLHLRRRRQVIRSEILFTTISYE